MSRATHFVYCTTNDLPNCAANQVSHGLLSWGQAVPARDGPGCGAAFILELPYTPRETPYA